MSLLHEIVDAARATIESGYYTSDGRLKRAPSLVAAVRAARARTDPALIAEIKPATPTRGKLVDGGFETLVERFLREGACALSVLTEPKHFHGSLANLRLAVRSGAPTLMKDFIVDERQIDCAASHGASAVLLIASLVPGPRLAELIEYAHAAEREVLLECGSRPEVERALKTAADAVGVNNRDLHTFRLDLERTEAFTTGLRFDRPLVSLSGFASPVDVSRVRGKVDAILVGSSLVDGTTTVAELLGVPR